MPISNAEFAHRAIIFIALALTPLIVWLLFDVVLIVTGAVLVAVLLHIVARPFRKIRLPRALALAVAGLLILLVISGVFYLFGSGMGNELQEIVHRANEGQKQITALLQGSNFGKTVLSHVQAGTFSLPDLLARVFRISASFLAGAAIAIVAGAFVAAEPELYRQGLSLLFPQRYRANANETIDYLAGALRLWTLGQLVDMAFVGVSVGVASWLVGLPSPYALGAIAGVAQFVPYIGSVLAFIPAALVATTVGWSTLMWTAIAYFLIHQFDGYVFMPMVQRRMVSVPPALMLVSIVALGELFGVTATVFAAPITVLLYVLVTKLYVRETLHEEVAVPGEAAAQPPK
jgi:predicted PurR-regulated permease PerM